MDKFNSKALGYTEFRKVLNDYKLGLKEPEIRALFSAFDVSNIGKVDYEEFMKIVRVSESLLNHATIGKNERISYRINL